MPSRTSPVSFFPCHDDIDVKPTPARLSGWASRIYISARLVATPRDVALDTDGDSLLVRGEAMGFPDTLIALPADPAKRKKPTYVGAAPVATWFAAPPLYPEAPAVLATDLRAASAAAGSGCAVALICVDPTRREEFKRRAWFGPHSMDALNSFMHRYAAATSFILASSPGSDGAANILATLATSLRYVGCKKTIIQCSKTDLNRFQTSGLIGHPLLVNFLEGIRYHSYPPGVPLSDIFVKDNLFW